jgi:hypothetical protein
MSTPPSAPIIFCAPLAWFPNTLEYTWRAPANPGSSPITNYRLTLNPGNLVYVTSADTYYKVEGLTNGIFYQTKIEATNNGTLWSDPAYFREFMTGSPPIAAPTTVYASTLGFGEAVIGWTQPVTLPDAQILWYVVTTNSTSRTDTVISTNGYALMQSNLILSGLNSNSTYFFNVRAVNCPGYGPGLSTNTVRWTIPFSPTQLAGMQLWLDASDDTTITRSGINVTGWADKNTPAKTTTVSANRPTIVTGSLNSLNTVRFTATSTTTVTASLATVIGTGSVTMITLWKPTASDTQAVSGIGITGAGGNLGVGYNGTGFYNIYEYGGSQSTYNSATTNVWVIEAGQRQLGTIYLSWNGNPPTTTGSSSTNFTNTSMYVGGGAGFYATGEVAESIFYNTVITPYERQEVEGYLAWKWGLQTSLPTSHPFYTSRPTATSVFSPTMFSSMQFWLDATQLTGLTNGQAMTTWVDRSSNAYSGTAVNGPTYQTNVLNSLPVVRLNGTNQYFNFRDVLNIGTSPGITIFSIVNYNDASGNGGIISKSLFGGAVSRWGLVRGSYSTPNSMSFLVASSTNPTVAPEASNVDTSTGFRMVEGLWDRSSMFLYKNGAQVGTNTLSDSGNYTTSLSTFVGVYNDTTGGGPLAGYYLNGDIAEILVYMRPLSTQDRQTVEGYLAWKWGLQNNLATTHPYYNNNPAVQTTYDIVTDSLILYLDPGNSASYPGSGTTLFDLSPAKNHCTLVGSPTYSATEHGKFTFNGTTQYITTPISSFDKPFTLSFWVKFSSLSGWQTFFSQDTSASVLRARFYFQKAGTAFSGSIIDYLGFSIVLSNDTAITTNASAAATTGVWLNYTVTVSATQVKMYTNGVLNNTTDTTQALLTGNTNLVLNAGYYNNAFTDFINGDTSVFLIYTKVLTDAEVLQNYNAMKMKYT